MIWWHNARRYYELVHCIRIRHKKVFDSPSNCFIMFAAVITFRHKFSVLLILTLSCEDERKRKFANIKERFGNLVETRKNITRDENLYYVVIKISDAAWNKKKGRKNINKKLAVVLKFLSEFISMYTRRVALSSFRIKIVQFESVFNPESGLSRTRNIFLLLWLHVVQLALGMQADGRSCWERILLFGSAGSQKILIFIIILPFTLFLVSFIVLHVSVSSLEHKNGFWKLLESYADVIKYQVSIQRDRKWLKTCIN